MTHSELDTPSTPSLKVKGLYETKGFPSYSFILYRIADLWAADSISRFNAESPGSRMLRAFLFVNFQARTVAFITKFYVANILNFFI